MKRSTRQDNRQAAENYSPPLAFAAWRPRLEIHYKMTRQAWLEEYRIGLPRLSLTWCLLWITGLSLLISVILLTFWAVAVWLPGSPFPWHTLKHMSLVIGPCAIGFVLAGYFNVSEDRLLTTRTQVVQITPQKLLLGEIIPQNFWLAERRGSYQWRGRYRWRRVTEIFVTDEYVCFCLGLPTATLVPKADFKSDEQIRAFVEQAGLYWRKATRRGEPLLNPANYLPCAPAHSQEPDSNP
jgi:hypothetical protein